MKSVKKQRYFTANDFLAAASYFRDMAREGLFLEEIRPYSYLFREGEPKEMDYYVRFGQEEPTADEALSAQGWEYICAAQGWLVFAAEQGTEPPADTEEQLLQWKKQMRRQLKDMILSVIVWGTLFFANSCNTKTVWTQGNGFVRGTVALVCFCMLFAILREGQVFLTTRRVWKQKRQGAEVSQEVDWRKAAWLGRLWQVLYFLLLLILVGSFVCFR